MKVSSEEKLVASIGVRTPVAIAGLGRFVMNAALPRARLLVGHLSSEARIAGFFERARAGDVRRVSGGATVSVGAGTVHMLLAAPDVASLDSTATVASIVNRHVRPLLRAMGRFSGIPAHYFGRDWVSVAHRPVANVGFAHDATTGRMAFEAFIAVTSPFALEPSRRAFLGKEPATLASVTGREHLTAEALLEGIVRAYAEAYGPAVVSDESGDPLLAAAIAGATEDSSAEACLVRVDDPPWEAIVEEAIGQLGARRDSTNGGVKIGGELLVSRDAWDGLERRASVLFREPPPTLERWTELVRSHLGGAQVALEGVTRLESVGIVLDSLARNR